MKVVIYYVSIYLCHFFLHLRSEVVIRSFTRPLVTISSFFKYFWLFFRRIYRSTRICKFLISNCSFRHTWRWGGHSTAFYRRSPCFWLNLMCFLSLFSCFYFDFCERNTMKCSTNNRYKFKKLLLALKFTIKSTENVNIIKSTSSAQRKITNLKKKKTKLNLFRVFQS